VLVAFVAVALSVLANGHAWAAIVAGKDSTAIRSAYYLALPSKYVPGGFAQPFSQVTLTRSNDVSLHTSVAAFLLHSLTVVVATAVVGCSLVFAGELPTPFRIGAALAPMSIVLLWRPLLASVARRVSRLRKAPDGETLALPNQRSILIALSWTIGGIVLAGIGFGSIGGSIGRLSYGDVVSAFSFAYLVGFLAVPFPAGIGVREGVLAIALPLSLPAVIALSGFHRVLTMAAEFTVMLSTRRRGTSTS
jgi:hypothetical protein